MVIDFSRMSCLVSHWQQRDKITLEKFPMLLDFPMINYLLSSSSHLTPRPLLKR